MATQRAPGELYEQRSNDLRSKRVDADLPFGPGEGRKLPVRRGVARLGAFACIVAVLAFVLNAAIDSGLRRIRTSSFGVSNRIVDGKVNAEIVITGSSRALTHYDPRPLEQLTGLSTFNIGVNGSQTDMQVAWLETYLQHNRKPLLVVHNLDLFTFQTTHGGVYDPGQYIPYLREPALYSALVRIDPNIWKSRFVPLYGYAVEDLRFDWILGIFALVGWNPSEDHIRGFHPRQSAWTEDFERFKAMNPGGARFAIESDGIGQMENLIALCKAHRIEVLLVYSPEYVGMQRLTKNRDQVFAQFEQLRERFGVSVWDYSDDPISSNRAYFYNSQHLNADGAEAFSRVLAARLASHLSSTETVRSPTGESANPKLERTLAPLAAPR